MKTLLLVTSIAALALGSNLSARECETHHLPLVAAVTTAKTVAVKIAEPVEPKSEENAKAEPKTAKKKSGNMDYFLYDYGFWWTPVD